MRVFLWMDPVCIAAFFVFLPKSVFLFSLKLPNWGISQNKSGAPLSQQHASVLYPQTRFWSKPKVQHPLSEKKEKRKRVSPLSRGNPRRVCYDDRLLRYPFTGSCFCSEFDGGLPLNPLSFEKLVLVLQNGLFFCSYTPWILLSAKLRVQFVPQLVPSQKPQKTKRRRFFYPC